MFASASVVAMLSCATLQLQAATIVDTELLLLVDVSGSVDSNEYNLMMQGYAEAFRSSDVLSAIQAGSEGTIAVALAFWSGSSDQAMAVNWTAINSSESANAFADAISQTVRPYSGMTAIGSALEYGATTFGTETGGLTDNGFTSISQIIDISGDGYDNNTPPDNVDRALNVKAASEAALASGVDMINGLPIGNAGGDLVGYYETYVIGGEAGGVDAFAQPTDTFSDVQSSLEKKLVSEVGAGASASQAVPEPSSILLVALGGISLLWRRSK